jgi:hypothetical protein
VPAHLQAAGRCRFYGNGAEILFPDQYNRRPFYTTFQERNPPSRTLRLFTMHTSPGTARDGLARMLDIAERIPGNNEVSLIIGDINVNINQMSTVESATMQFFAMHDHFRVLLPPLNQIFSPTRVLARTGATPAQYLTNELLDYGLVRWGPNALPPGIVSQVVDRVAGAPQPYTSDMVAPLATIGNIQNADERDERFRQRWNYGHIAQPRRNDEVPDLPGDGTSDHIPIYVSV